MFLLRSRLRPLTWLALVAVLAMALLPTVSHALSLLRGDAAGWAEVCTPQGTRLVALDSSDMPAPADGGTPKVQAHFEHCPFCMPSGAGLAPPPAVLMPALLVQGTQAVPRLFLQAPRTLFAWRSAQPRGPPSFS